MRKRKNAGELVDTVGLVRSVLARTSDEAISPASRKGEDSEAEVKSPSSSGASRKGEDSEAEVKWLFC